MPTSHEQLERDEAAERADGDVAERGSPVTTELPGDEPQADPEG